MRWSVMGEWKGSRFEMAKGVAHDEGEVRSSRERR